jgi:hypothetical protein
MSSSNEPDIIVILDYIAGRCDPRTQDAITRQLQDPASSASQMLEQLRSVANLALSDDMLLQTDQVVRDVLPSEGFEDKSTEEVNQDESRDRVTSLESDSRAPSGQDSVLSTVARGSMIGATIGVGAAFATTALAPVVMVPFVVLGAFVGAVVSWCFSSKKNK